MTSGSPTDLPWLLPPPSDFSARCRAVDGPAVGQELRTLATYAVTDPQIGALARAIARQRARGEPIEGLSPLKLGVISSLNHALATEALVVGAARHGVLLSVVNTDYGQVMQEALDPASSINAAGLDAVLLSLDARWLGLDKALPQEEPDAAVAAALDLIETAIAAVRTRGGATPIIETLAPPPGSLFGGFDRSVAGTVRAMLERVNAALPTLVRRHGGQVLDVSAIAAEVGTRVWFDLSQRAAYKLPFASRCLPLYADHLGRLLGAMRGRSRKCLVLDLDDTLWGGVIGDDGIGGIALGQGSARGEIYLEVQRVAQDLRRRGVVLAVCSKNTEAVARAAFRDHPEMILTEADIAVFCANWDNKPDNLKRIAETLNIGLDALVFFDDNPIERDQVRRMLPAVAVPELPEDPSAYPWLLTAPGYFEAVAFSAEDRGRAESYRTDALRAEARAHAGDVETYLRSLDMRLTMSPFDADNRARITQLINKTNQFNLTTRRFTEAEIEELVNGGAALTLQARLTDRFSDLGMIAVVICRLAEDDPQAWEIDTFLMSCRALGRKVEIAIVRAILEAADRAGVKTIRGRYVPSARNEIVADLYPRLGFAMLDRSGTEVRYQIPVCAAGPWNDLLPFVIV